jgi:hypothetical protein
MGHALEEEQDGQGAGNEEDVVEIAVQKIIIDVRLEDPAIQRVEGATDQK